MLKIVYFKIIFLKFTAVTEDPEFTDVIENITVPAGRNVKLACSVKNLGSYKVSQFKIILSICDQKAGKQFYTFSYIAQFIFDTGNISDNFHQNQPMSKSLNRAEKTKNTKI